MVKKDMFKIQVQLLGSNSWKSYLNSNKDLDELICLVERYYFYDNRKMKYRIFDFKLGRVVYD